MPQKHRKQRPQEPKPKPKRIEDYALIGDCESAALVSRDGAIDWLCWPRFDSGAVFSALLGDVDNGTWQLHASGRCRSRRRYAPESLVLETTIETETGRASVIDFMPFRKDGSSHVVRLVRGQSGRVDMRSRITLRFDYGSLVPWVTRSGDDAIMAVAGPDMVILRSNRAIRAHGFSHESAFEVAAGETVWFVLSYVPSFGAPPEPLDPERALAATLHEWQQWVDQYRHDGPYAAAVVRSLITLKALTFRRTGGIVAAPTTSLPERVGGTRNWDYRFCWLRDATFTLLALLDSGFTREARDWRRWLRHAVAGMPAQVQIMYGLAGERRLDEWEIPWLAGYENSKPVRVGNAAASQRQLDIFGEVIDALFHGECAGLHDASFDWDLQKALIEHLEGIWREPDEGIWEVRGGRRHFTHSKVMAWVAFDRAVKSIERFGVSGPLARWRKVRDEIHREVCRRAFNAKVGAFVQSYGVAEVDASALLIPLVGFLPAQDPRVRATIDVIGRDLDDHGFIRRYRTAQTKDGLKGREGAFLACSFWYVDCLILLGRTREARTRFHKLLALCNDVGLLSEEYDGAGRRMLGNFPQAFSHVALINTAHNLSRLLKPATQRAQPEMTHKQPMSQPLPMKPGKSDMPPSTVKVVPTT